MMVACAQLPSGDLQPGERPGLETTEAGLWMHMDKLEDRLKASGHVVEDDTLDAYLRDIVCRLEPAHCPNIRIYVGLCHKLECVSGADPVKLTGWTRSAIEISIFHRRSSSTPFGFMHGST